MPPAPDTEVAAAAQQHFRTLLEIVYEVLCGFRPADRIRFWQHYTPEHFERIGKTIEDAEEELSAIRVAGRRWGRGVRRGTSPIASRCSWTPCGWGNALSTTSSCGISAGRLRHPGRFRRRSCRTMRAGANWKSGGNVWIPQELRKTGTPEGDIDAYIASLKRETPVPVAVAVAAEKDDFHRLRELIFAAVSRIQPGLFRGASGGDRRARDPGAHLLL